jgi:hypothetical protein
MSTMRPRERRVNQGQVIHPRERKRDTVDVATARKATSRRNPIDGKD